MAKHKPNNLLDSVLQVVYESSVSSFVTIFIRVPVFYPLKLLTWRHTTDFKRSF